MTSKVLDSGLNIVFSGTGRVVPVTDVGSCMVALFVIIEALLDNKAKA